MENEDPRNQEFVSPYDHPSLISSYPATVGTGQSGIEARDEKFLEALREYLQNASGSSIPSGVVPVVPIVRLHGRAPGIDIAKTLALEVYRDFPDKERWL